MNLSLQHICRSFGSVEVLKDVDLTLKSGEILALLGENGAGKSTLMNILGGVLPQDAGQILLDGREVHFENPAESLNAGIGFIHQELNLIDHLTVCENLFLNRPEKKGIFLDQKSMARQTRELFQEMGICLDPESLAGDLDPAYRQMTEIGRALLQKASVIIMDEPTTSLNQPEIERIFELLRSLKKQGVSIIFISHKLNEVMEICDRYLVLRDGRVSSEGAVSETSPEQLAEAMVGHRLTGENAKKSKDPGEAVLRLVSFTREPCFRDISLSVHSGEIYGVTGLLGSGVGELFRTVFGDFGTDYRGTIYYQGRETGFSSPVRARKAGIAYLPRDRKENGIIKDMSVLENGTVISLERFRRLRFLRGKRIWEAFDEKARALRIKMGRREDPVGSLSGGNQQKVILARWLMMSPKLLILDNPTQGVDVGAKEEIYGIIRSLAEAGAAVVVLSPESQEILRLCDRCMVLVHGNMAGELRREEMTEQRLMLLAAGGGEKGEKDENNG